MRHQSFKPVTPRNLTQVLEGRVGRYRQLVFDTGSLKLLNKVPGHGLYLNSDWSKMLLYLEFSVNGQCFRRRCVNEAMGNYGVLWVKVGGTTYQLTEA